MPDFGNMSLLDCLRGSFDRPLSELDASLRWRVEKACLPNRWDDLEPEVRRDVVSSADASTESASEEELLHSWELGCRVLSLENQVIQLKDTQPTTVSEIAIKRQLLAGLSDELEHLNGRATQPTAGNARGIAGLPADRSNLLTGNIDDRGTTMKPDNTNPSRGSPQRTAYEQWLAESRYDGWFARLNHQTFTEHLIEFVCCYPDGNNEAVPRNRERIENAIVDVVCQDVPCDEKDVPSHALEAFRAKFSAVVKLLKKPLPKDEHALNLKVWEAGFPGKWRPDATELGEQALWQGFGYTCWIDAHGKSRWAMPRFVPGRDYDADFRGMEDSKRCRLEVVRAIAEYRARERGSMLNPMLAAALAPQDDHLAEVNQEQDKHASGKQKRYSDEELLAILADSEKLPRAAHAKKLNCSERWLRKLLEKARQVAAAGKAAKKWT